MVGRAAMIAVLLAPTASIARQDDHSTGVTPPGRSAVEICSRIFSRQPFKGGQHWGAHFAKWAALKQPMPVACVVGGSRGSGWPQTSIVTTGVWAHPRYVLLAHPARICIKSSVG
jgi:hypothetical protein